MTQFSNLGLDSFYMLPKVLFELKCPLSLEAKVLFTLILDRADLSFMNDWRDKNGHLYVYYTVEEAQTMLGCGRSKAIRVFQELEEKGFIRSIPKKGAFVIFGEEKTGKNSDLEKLILELLRLKECGVGKDMIISAIQEVYKNDQDK